MADARSVGPSDRDVAGFSKLAHAPARWGPTNIETASRERDQRPGAGRPNRQVRFPERRLGDARRPGWTRAEYLGVNVACSDAPGREASSPLAHEARRTAYLEIGSARHEI